jgi:Streptomyces sporulation and cell division protein, SsgA
VFATVARSLCGRLFLDRYTATSVPILARLFYRPDDPMAVMMTFPAAVSPDGGSAEWVFSRELLDRGLSGPSGEGDVRIRPSGPERTVIEFISRDGSALVELSSESLRQFLRWAYAAVPPGEEAAHLDLDTVVADLLDDA